MKIGTRDGRGPVNARITDSDPLDGIVELTIDVPRSITSRAQTVSVVKFTRYEWLSRQTFVHRVQAATGVVLDIRNDEEHESVLEDLDAEYKANYAA